MMGSLSRAAVLRPRGNVARNNPYFIGSTSLLALTIAMAASTAMAQSLPTGGTVTHGDAAIANSGSNLLVTQSSQNAIISWQSFSVGGGATAHFENGTGATLNRVTGNLPSSIDGSLTATGSLYLINPAGVAVGTGGMVRTGGSFIASTHDASDADFLNGGDLTLKGGSKAEVVNRGFVTSLSGDVVLTARRVENAGTIEAANGSVGLLGGYEVLLRDTSLADGKFAVKVGGADTEVVNTGTVRAAEVEMRANGGSVQALAGNTKAIVKATGVKKVGGRIFLTAGDGGTVKATQKIVARRAATQATRTAVAALPDIGPLPAARPDFEGGEVRIAGGTVSIGGVIDASGSGGPGGTITATAGGGSLSLLSTAALDASGGTGGLVLLGGDYQGGADPATRYLDMPMERAAATSVAAGATIAADGSEGDGGAVVVWSDGATTVKGQITARGGATGDGGTIETSGHTIDFTDARINASAQNGLAGTWLIDPVDLLIGKAAAETAESMLNGGTNATFATRDSSAGGPNGYVTSTGPGDITVAAPITWSTGATLTLDAYHSIVINAPITVAGAGGLALLTNQGGGSGGTLSFAGGVQYTGSGGSLTINSQPYTLLYSMADLQGINTDAGLSGRYALAKSLDASAIPANGAGEWIPLGTSGAGILNGSTGFSGDFTGLGNTISNLTVDTGSNGWTGLFGWMSGAISDIGLIGGSVNGGSRVGSLVGVQNGGEIARSYATGTVTGSGTRVGGLVGVQIGGTITQAYATGAVQGDSAVGGLVGHQDGGMITQAYATGAVTGSGINIGGLVGLQDGGSTEQAYATGAVTGGSDVGGLVGWQNGGSITNSYFDSYSTGRAASNGVGNVANASGVLAVTSDPTKSADSNYAYKQSAYGNLTFTATPGASGWYMTDGQTRPFGAWEYSQNIANSHQLQLVNMDLGASYQLARSLDLVGEFGRAGVSSPTAAESAGMWNSGFVPLGTDGVGGLIGGNGFAGTFTGSGKTISNLTVDTGNADYAGLFGWSSGAISDIGLIGGSVKGGDYTGGLVGYAAGGSVARSYTTGAVTGNLDVGGLVGLQVGDITQSYAMGKVDGSGGVGGLVGYQSNGTISESYATGEVKGVSYIGGLVGTQWGGITGSYATGAVTGTSEYAGGLVGYQQGDIAQSYATGAVKGVLYVGGLVGYQQGDIAQSYATGAVKGVLYVGGLVGAQLGGIIDAHATGAVVGGGDYVGGLVGFVDGGTITRAYAAGTVDGHVAVGGLVGYANNSSVVAQSYATGAVTAGGNYAGGLVGYQKDTTVSDSYASGPVAGVYFVGGLAGELDGGSISTSYATGAISGQMYLGGLFGFASGAGSATDSYFDTQTTGQGGAGGLTTAQLQAALQAGFDPAVWGILPGLSYPYLKWRFPLGPSVVSGKAIDIAGGNDRLGVGLGIDGNLAAYGYTGANGYYSFMVDPATAGSSALTWLTGARFPGATVASRANAVGEMPASGIAGFGQGMASGLDLYAETVNVKTALPTYTDIAAMMARALYGDGTGVPLTVQLPDVYVLRYDSSCGCDVSFFPGDANSPQASVRIDASAPLLTWDGAFDSLFPPLNATILAAGDVLVTSSGGIGSSDVSGIGGGTVAMTVGGNLTFEQQSAIISDKIGLTVGGNLSMGAGSLMLAIGGPLADDGPLTMAVTGNLSLGTDAAIFAATVLDATVGGNVAFAGAPNIGFQVLAGDAIRIGAGGDFTMAPDTHLVAGGTGDAIQLAVGGKFINHVVPDDDPAAALPNALVLADPDNARWVVYLASPTGGHTFGGLDSGNTAVWNTGAFAPVAASGNRYVFSYQPTLTFTSLDATKTYGETGTPFGYSVGGLMPGVAGAYLSDMAASAYSGALHLSSFGDPATAGVAGGPYTIDIDGTGLTSTAGYAFAFANAGRLTVTPRAITVSGNDQSRLQGQPDPALTWSITGGSLASFDTTGTVFSGGLTRMPGEAPGYYAIGRGSLAANANYTLVFLGGVLAIDPPAMTQGQVLERSGAGQSLFLASSGGEDDAFAECAEGVLGPVCAAFVNPGNRDLGPNISWQAP
jgi:filamentous hemagglutinin family protein